ncbi:hypothetical protein CFter6_1677 [Collimonas fungivorans]|uniref:Uncharacterized protein n=1 Tax=Collimonas fungivorans TaxID=158899 RepID=A0A127P981_9BURK|nr:AAA family ATPase [Collimonas fungivorans]AMO94379.1 hypothetical protein CFter6_1677 [Collimonas fungivorans]
MYLSEIQIKNFRQFGAEEQIFCVSFHEGMTALGGENDVKKSSVVDAIRHVHLTRDIEFMRPQPDDFHIRLDMQPAVDVTTCSRLLKLPDSSVLTGDQ